jgi:hypothetical protein
LPAAPLFLLLAAAATAQDVETFRIELTGSAWLVNSGGSIQSGVEPIDLQADLGLEQSKPTFFGSLVLKPTARNRLVVEGAPYRLSGERALRANSPSMAARITFRIE